MYFLVASGLSLIYGLMGVLNFAHGALLTVGAYATWWMSTQVGGGSGDEAPRRPRSSASPSAPCSRRSVELVLIRPLYLRPDRAGARHGRPRARPRRARRGDLGLRRAAVPGARLDDRHDHRSSAPRSRTTASSRSRAAGLVLLGLTAFLRYTRYGLIIRAGVENRAMVTALGIDVRKAFTLVFALGGAAAALAGVLSGVYFGVDRPGPRHVAPDLRLHRRRDRRLRLDRRYGCCGRGRRPAPAVRELLRLERARRSRCRPPARDRAPDQARGPLSQGGALTRLRPFLVPVAASSWGSRSCRSSRSTSRSCSEARWTAPGRSGCSRCASSSQASRSRTTSSSASPASSRSGTRSYFAIGAYLTDDRADEVGVGARRRRCSSSWCVGILVPLLLGAISLRVSGIAFAMVTLAFAQAGTVLVQKNPNGLTGRGGGRSASTSRRSRIFRRSREHAEPLLAGSRLHRGRVPRSSRWAINSSPGHVWQAIRENERRVEVIGLQPLWFKLLASCSPRSSRPSAA